MIILHDLDGRPYYQAVEKVCSGRVRYVESSVLKIFLRALLKKQWNGLFKSAVKNTLFRLSVPFIKGETIILGAAPYDFRILWYGQLARSNAVVLHTSWPYWGGEKYPRRYGFVDVVLTRVWKRFLNRPNVTIVAVSSAAFDTVRTFSGRHAGVWHIPHVVDRRIFYPAKSRLDSGPLKILFVGKLIPEKGIGLLLSLYRQLPTGEFTFSVVGDGELRHLVESRGGTDLHYHGWISDKVELAQIYRAHDVLVVPSQATNKWEELFGIVIAEAMACGLAVVASDHVGPSAIVQDGTTGFLLDEAAETAWVDAIQRLRASPQLLRSMQSVAAVKSEEYDIDEVSKQWADVLMQCEGRG